jgi:hypothetical protein
MIQILRAIQSIQRWSSTQAAGAAAATAVAGLVTDRTAWTKCAMYIVSVFVCACSQPCSNEWGFGSNVCKFL